MEKIKAFIERGNDGSYSVYVDLNDNKLNYGIHGDGNSVQEAIDDFNAGYQEMKESYENDKKPFVEAEFEFEYDMASFLNFYTEYFSLAGLSRLTGVAQGQLSHYVTGRRRPSRRTINKIDTSVHNFARKINRVAFI